MVERARTGPADAGRVTSGLRAELERIRESLQVLDRGLAELDARGAEGGRSRRPRTERYLRVLVEVYERGGQHGVDSDGFAEVGRELGYDRRGLGGFFTGPGAALRRMDGRVRLTPAGEQLMEEYLGGERQ